MSRTRRTGILWTEYTFNGWIGCTKVSPGCHFCYAEVDRATVANNVLWGTGQPRHRTSPDNWKKPLRWNRTCAVDGTRTKVFSASLSDWLDPEVPVEWLADLLELIDKTPNLDWQLLTKRPELWESRMQAVCAFMRSTSAEMGLERLWRLEGWLNGISPANVWVGTTCEDQKRANERIPALLRIPARIRFLSCEPLLEPVNLFLADRPPERGLTICDFAAYNSALGDLNWVIVGGESGTKARPFNPDWALQIVQDCKAAGVPVFVKQMGTGNGFTGKGGDMDEWNPLLRIWEFPKGA